MGTVALWIFGMVGILCCGTTMVGAEDRGDQLTDLPQENRAIAVASESGNQQAATVQRERVLVAGGATVTVLRPVAAKVDQAASQEEDVKQEPPVQWQVAGGRRLWLIDPVTEDLRTCAMRQTSTVGVTAIRCVSVSGSRFRRALGATFAP